MQTFIVILICMTAFASEQVFEKMLERHAPQITQASKEIKSFAALGPDIKVCFDDDVKDFAKCVMSLKKETQ